MRLLFSLVTNLFAGPRRWVSLLLGLALLGALWLSFLTLLSDRAHAVPILTDAGTEIVNPLLLSNGSGLGETAYTTLQAQAKAQPDQPLTIPFLKPKILGREIVGKSAAEGTSIIYAHVANAYYDGGADAAFGLGPINPDLQRVVSGFGLVTKQAAQQAGSSLPVNTSKLPQLPPYAQTIVSSIGLSADTFTAHGHDNITTSARYFYIAAALLAGLLALIGRGWARVSSVGWALFHAAWVGVVVLGVVWLLIRLNPSAFASYSGLIGHVGAAAWPVYGGAALAGLAGVFAARLAGMAGRMRTARHAMRKIAPAAAPESYASAQQGPRQYTPPRPQPQGSLPRANAARYSSFPPAPSYSPGPQSPYDAGQGYSGMQQGQQGYPAGPAYPAGQGQAGGQAYPGPTYRSGGPARQGGSPIYPGDQGYAGGPAYPGGNPAYGNPQAPQAGYPGAGAPAYPSQPPTYRSGGPRPQRPGYGAPQPQGEWPADGSGSPAGQPYPGGWGEGQQYPAAPRPPYDPDGGMNRP
jgi:hypothetical protein